MGGIKEGRDWLEAPGDGRQSCGWDEGGAQSRAPSGNAPVHPRGLKVVDAAGMTLWVTAAEAESEHPIPMERAA
eukprot:2608012-Prymnesium_polylepis.1